MPKVSELSKLRGEVEELRKQLLELSEPRRARIEARKAEPEKVDPVPMEVPVQYRDQTPTTKELVQQYVASAMSRWAEDNDFGSFTEEDDFDEEDPEVLPLSGFEVAFEEDEFSEPVPISPEDAPEAQGEAPEEPTVGTAAPAVPRETEPAPGPENQAQ